MSLIPTAGKGPLCQKPTVCVCMCPINNGDYGEGNMDGHTDC